MDTPPTLEELFAETARGDPKPMTRSDHEELTRTVLADPDVLDPMSVSASSKSTSAPQQSDARKSLRDLLKAKIRPPLPSTVYGFPLLPFQPFPLPVEKEAPKVDYLKTSTFSVDTVSQYHQRNLGGFENEVDVSPCTVQTLYVHRTLRLFAYISG
jgi:hypothetical protein